MKPLQAEIYLALRTQMRHATNIRPRERAQWSQMGEVVMCFLQAASNPALLARAVTGADGASLQWPSLAIRPNSDLGEKVLHYGQHEVAAKFEKLVMMVAANAAAGRKTAVHISACRKAKPTDRRRRAPPRSIPRPEKEKEARALLRNSTRGAA
jgi:hypothetical protein